MSEGNKSAGYGYDNTAKSPDTRKVDFISRSNLGEERLEKSMENARKLLELGDIILNEFKQMKYQVGDVVIHKDLGKGIIIDKFHKDVSGEHFAITKDFTGYGVIIVTINGGAAECARYDCKETELVPYTKEAETLFVRPSN